MKKLAAVFAAVVIAAAVAATSQSAGSGEQVMPPSPEEPAWDWRQAHERAHIAPDACTAPPHLRAPLLICE